MALVVVDFRVAVGRRVRELRTEQRFRLSGGTDLSFITAGDPSRPAVLLLHGFPGSVRTFRDFVPELSRVACVIAPDLPGFGESDVLPAASFPAFGQAISELLDRLAIGPRYLYLHAAVIGGGLFAVAGPARRAIRADPTEALRVS